MIQSDASQRNQNPPCRACEEMLADAQDEALTPADQAWFERHLASCVACSQMVADAQRGAAWLEMLKTPRPEPSSMLVERILAQTSGRFGPELADTLPVAIQTLPFLVPQPLVPAPRRGVLLPFPARMPIFRGFEPRLAMTAAMAFFSIALTLSLSGVRLNELHASDLKAANLKRTYYEANAQAIRFYDSLRVVRVLESRVEDLREASGQDAGPRSGGRPRQTPESLQGQPQTPKREEEKKSGVGKGMSMRRSPMALPGATQPEETNHANQTTQPGRQLVGREEGGPV